MAALTPGPPDVPGEDEPPAARNLALAVARLLADIEDAPVLTQDHRRRIHALRRATRRFLRHLEARP